MTRLRVIKTGEIGKQYDHTHNFFRPGGDAPDTWIIFVAEDGEVRFYLPEAVEEIEVDKPERDIVLVCEGEIGGKFDFSPFADVSIDEVADDILSSARKLGFDVKDGKIYLGEGFTITTIA